MKKHPVIGVNMSLDIVDKYEKYGMLVPVSYVDAISGSGGLPVCIPPYTDPSMCEEILPFLDGMLFIGGDDYLPDHYGGHPQPAKELVPERRDRFDLALATFVLKETELPVLAICGGHQLISIASGGALIQDIRSEWKSSPGVQPLTHSGTEREGSEKVTFRHSVKLEPGSMVERATQVSPGDDLKTNSYHHQAVHPEKTGCGLRATAWSGDGIVEAIEPTIDSAWARSDRFILGIQWHPERLQEEEPHRNIFAAFIEACRNA
jgi:putative glutamine amidotransferase